MFYIDQYLAVGTDAAAYLVLALSSTLAYVLKLVTGFFGDVDGTDIDIDAGADTFSLLSLLSVLAFLMGFGWMGLVSRVSWSLGPVLSALLATGFGTGLLFGTAFMMNGLRRMTHIPRYSARSALGRTVKVYLTIPPKGQGQGQVEVTVSGRRKVMAAVSASDQIPAFAAARIVDLRKDDVFVVESTDLPRDKSGSTRSGDVVN